MLTHLACSLALTLGSSLITGDGQGVHDEPRVFVALSKAVSCERPYILDFGGGLGVAYDVSGGLPNTMTGERFAPYSPIVAAFSFYGDRTALRLLASSVAGQSTANHYSIYSTQKGLRSATGFNSFGFTADGLVPVAALFPACDTNLKELRGVAIAFAPTKVDRGQFALTNAGLEVAKKQKLWTCSNFRLRIGGLPTERVTHVDPVTVSITDWTEPTAAAPSRPIYGVSHLAFRIPRDDAGPFYELHKATLAGTPKIVPVTLEFLDDDGSTVAQIGMGGNTCEVEVASSFVATDDPGAEVEVVIHPIKTTDTSPTTGNLELIIK